MKKHAFAKKLFAGALAMLMLMLPLSALAEDAESTGETSGETSEETSPYGKLMVSMANPNESSVTYLAKGVTVSSNTPKVNADRGSGDEILATSTNGFGGISINTNLPLDADSRYTIVYSAKKDVDTDLGFFLGLCDNIGWPYYGADFLISNDSVVTHHKYWTNGWATKNDPTDFTGVGAADGFENIWTKFAGEDGYVQFVLTLDKGMMTLSVGGTPIGKVYNLNRATDKVDGGRPCAINFNSFKTKTLLLEAGFSNVMDNTKIPAPAAGTVTMHLKDISIYETPVETPYLTFKDPSGGNVQKIELPADGSGVTVTEYPAYESTKQVVWVYAETGAVFTLPATVTEPTNVVAMELGKNASHVLDATVITGADGKKSLRLVGGVFNTEANGVGFDITVSYTKDGVTQTRQYRKSMDTIWKSVAFADGTVKTAEEFGAYWVFACTLQNLPEDLGDLNFQVKTYKELGAGKTRFTGAEETFVVRGGAVVLN